MRAAEVFAQLRAVHRGLPVGGDVGFCERLGDMERRVGRHGEWNELRGVREDVCNVAVAAVEDVVDAVLGEGREGEAGVEGVVERELRHEHGEESVVCVGVVPRAGGRYGRRGVVRDLCGALKRMGD